MAHDASNNNPTKEIVHALIGIVLLLTMIAGIAISAWLRPAGNHEVATVPATEAGKVLEEKLKAIDAPKTEEAAPATAEAPADAAATATADAPKAEDADTATANAEASKADEATDTAKADAEVAPKAEEKPADTATEPKADEATAKAQ